MVPVGDGMSEIIQHPETIVLNDPTKSRNPTTKKVCIQSSQASSSRISLSDEHDATRDGAGLRWQQVGLVFGSEKLIHLFDAHVPFSETEASALTWLQPNAENS